MHFVDWMLVALPFILIIGLALYTRRYVRSVADFMAGGRNAGPYVLSTATSEKLAGAALFVATFEQFAKAGFTIGWWSQILVPVGLFVAITGFVIYRYRQTRALTLAQFFEMRYSRRFRFFAGALGFLAGIVNFGVIPAVGARFFVYFLQLPAAVSLGGVSIPTYLLLMGCFLGASIILTTLGGQITILVTDCVEGMMSQIFYVVIAIAMLGVFTWPQIHHVLLAQPAGQSLVNPFDTFSTKDFNLWFVLMLAFLNIYGTMAWQNSHAFNASAATPHDARMGGILGRWRYFASGVMVTVLAMCTLTFLQHPDYAAGAAQVQDAVNQIADAKTAQQMHWSIALSHILPIGIKGLLCTVLLMGVISGDGMAMHSWGSILVQDVIVPFRKRPLSVKQHLLFLRLAIIGVAVFAYVFGALFQQTDKLFLWWALTQAIFVGGAGVAIIGGLYWSRGTTTGAWAGMVTGSLLSVGGIALREGHTFLWGTLAPHWGAQAFGASLLKRFPEFPLNGMEISFYATLVAIVVYVVVSLFTCRQPHDMDRLLNRGAYAVEPEDSGHAVKKISWMHRIVGIDEHFSRSDRWVTLGLFGWSLFWFILFVVGSVVYLIHPWSDETWSLYWCITSIWLPLVIGVLTTLWFTIGGVHDLRLFFRRLRTEKPDLLDDGVVHADEVNPSAMPSAASDTRSR
ncbi:MAG: sodium:proline symporter [Verrucomicrobia bacterium]|nr:sodium:proline symporter [Verrucomicrobiota bacterium]